MRARRFVLTVALVAACGGSKPAPTGPSNDGTNGSAAQTGSATESGEPMPTGAAAIGIALTVTPPEATVTIDEVVYGKANEVGRVIALAPGLHTLVVAAPGFKAYRAEFSVTDKTEAFTIKLESAK